MVLIYYNAFVISTEILSKVDFIPAWVAAWAPNIIFTLLGVLRSGGWSSRDFSPGFGERESGERVETTQSYRLRSNERRFWAFERLPPSPLPSGTQDRSLSHAQHRRRGGSCRLIHPLPCQKSPNAIHAASLLSLPRRRAAWAPDIIGRGLKQAAQPNPPQPNPLQPAGTPGLPPKIPQDKVLAEAPKPDQGFQLIHTGTISQDGDDTPCRGAEFTYKGSHVFGRPARRGRV